MKQVTFDKVDINGGFWLEKQQLIRNVTMQSVYNRFSETGRFDAFDFNWKEGMPNKPHIFWDSDVAKWIEAAGYLIEKEPMPELEKIVDETVDKIVLHQDETGYFNSYYQVCEPREARFTKRNNHELYCCGHLIEAAIAYYHATGKDKLLKAMMKYADYVEKVFLTDDSADFSTPGHEEIELALIRLYDETKDERYLNLSRHFINVRGTSEKDEQNWPDKAHSYYNQSHLPVRQQKEALGHAVRALYLYTAMADLALRDNEEQLKNTCRDLFYNIYRKKMYITGAVGSTSSGEAFSYEYDLPNIRAYAETCANLALALFCRRMNLLEVNPDYDDAAERVIYNGFLSGLSLDGRSFFYENPLEINVNQRKREGEHYPITQRLEVFGCSCCPPNILRFISSIGDMIYTTGDNTVYIHQYISNTAEIDICGKTAEISLESGFPYSGKVSVKYNGPDAVIALRIPKWCTDYKGDVRNGFSYINVSDGSELNLDFGMKVRTFVCDPRAYENCGRSAVTYGPLIYCLEQADNGENLRDITLCGDFSIEYDPDFVQSGGKSFGVQTITCRAYRTSMGQFENNLYIESDRKNLGREYFTARLIPYFAFANRGESDMLIYVQTE